MMTVDLDAIAAHRQTNCSSQMAWSALVGNRLALFRIHQINWVNSCNGSALMIASHTMSCQLLL